MMSRFWNALRLELMGYCHKHGINRFEFLGECSDCVHALEDKHDRQKEQKAELAARLFKASKEVSQ